MLRNIQSMCQRFSEQIGVIAFMLLWSHWHAKFRVNWSFLHTTRIILIYCWLDWCS
jgi:hypothetical protein